MPFNSKDAKTHKNAVVLGTSDHLETSIIEDVISESESNELNQQELLFLLGLIKGCTFSGAQVEVVYEAAVKLQNQFLALEPKQ